MKISPPPAIAASCMAMLLLGGTSASAEIAMFSQRNFQGARYSLDRDSSNMTFSLRSVRTLDGERWLLCPRAFFGGNCITVSGNDAALSLPRAFSGVVRSARKLKAAKPAEAIKPAEAKPAAEAAKPAVESPSMQVAPEPKKPEPPKIETMKAEPLKPEPPKEAAKKPADEGKPPKQ